MATSTKRENGTNNNKNPGKGHNHPPKALATSKECGDALALEAESVSKSKDATANRYRVMLMRTVSDPDFASLVCTHYTASLAPNGQTAETRERVRASKNALYRLFNAPEIPEEKSKTEEASVTKKRELIQKNAYESIRLCDAIASGDYASSFDFHKNGGTYIPYTSKLGKHLWALNGWDKDETLNKRREEKGEKDIQLVASAWYTQPARAILWSDLTIAVAGAKREGQAPKQKRTIVSTSDVSNGLQVVANFYESNAPKVNEIAAIRGTLENARRIVNATVKGIPQVSEKLAAFVTAMDALINSFSDPNKTVKVEKEENKTAEKAA